MAGINAPERYDKTAAAGRNVAVSYVGKLDAGEKLDAAVTPTTTDVTVGGPADLTFTSKAVSTGALTINGLSVAAGLAVQFHVTGGTVGQTYTIRVEADSDASPAQTDLAVDLTLKVV